MRKGNRIYGIIATLLLSLGACSLIHDDPEELGYREDGSAYAYVSLTIHTGTAGNVTRSNPTGGRAQDRRRRGGQLPVLRRRFQLYGGAGPCRQDLHGRAG